MRKVKIFNSMEEAIKVIPPGQKRKVRIDQLVICLVNTGEQWLAFNDECPHLNESLSKGTMNSSNEIVCPWHSYRFNLKTGEEAKNRCNSLLIYEVEILESGLSVLIKQF